MSFDGSLLKAQMVGHRVSKTHWETWLVPQPNEARLLYVFRRLYYCDQSQTTEADEISVVKITYR